MKTVALGFVILFFLVSCSSTGPVTVDRSASAGTTASLTPPDREKPSRKAEGKSSRSSSARNRGEGKAAFDDDDNIASLLEHDDFKDFDLPIVFNDAVKYYIVYFTTDKKKVFANWLKRSRRYVPMIKTIMRQHGLPEDLVYVAMIESGFNPKAYSTAKACGPWQFIYETGGRYGLKVNFWIDERRDPEKSTVAAAKYLTDLFNQFGCWYLAAAGYNAGEKRVERAIEKHNTTDFWELSKYNALPRETREYIPKLIAAAIIAKDPERFGFGNISYEDPMRFAEMKVPRATPLTVISRASNTDAAELRSMNPELLRGITPPYTDEYRIKLRPTANVARVSADLEESLAKARQVRDVMVYKVKKKDTLAKILKKYGVREEELYLVNSCDDQIRVKPGMALNIPKFTGPARATPAVMTASLAPSKAEPRQPEKTQKIEKVEKAEKPDKTKTAHSETRPEPRPEKEVRTARAKEADKEQTTRTSRKPYHIVKRGETLSGISSKYGVEKASIMSANSMKSETVYPDMKLKLASLHTPTSSVKKKETSSSSRTVKVHVVRKGETLNQIAHKYGVNVASLKATNNLKGGKVSPNQRLKIVSVEG